MSWQDLQIDCNDAGCAINDVEHSWQCHTLIHALWCLSCRKRLTCSTPSCCTCTVAADGAHALGLFLNSSSDYLPIGFLWLGACSSIALSMSGAGCYLMKCVIRKVHWQHNVHAMQMRAVRALFPHLQGNSEHDHASDAPVSLQDTLCYHTITASRLSSPGGLDKGI